MTTYDFDTTLDPVAPVLTHGIAGEILPAIVSPLSVEVDGSNGTVRILERA